MCIMGNKKKFLFYKKIKQSDIFAYPNTQLFELVYPNHANYNSNNFACRMRAEAWVHIKPYKSAESQEK